MFEQIGHSSRRSSVDWTPVFACLGAAGITSILLDAFIVSHKLSASGAVIAAVVSVSAAVAVSAVAGRIAFRLFRPNVLGSSWNVVLPCSLVAVWLGPLWLTNSRAYLWSAVAAGAVAAAAAQVLRDYERSIADAGDESDGGGILVSADLFSGLTFPSRATEMLYAFSAAALTQLGLAATSTHNADAATLFFGAAGFLAGWIVRPRSADMTEKTRLRKAGVAFRLVAIVAVNALLFVSFSSRWFVAQAGQNGQGDSKKAASDDNLHSGIILLADVRRQRIMAPPPVHRPAQGIRTDAPIAIPFTGEYWVYRWPFQRPPASSIVWNGTPLAYTFTNVDQFSLKMLARQRFDQPLDVGCCSRIDVTIQNSDREAAAVSLEMLMVDTPAGQKERAVSLGEQRLTTRMLALGQQNPKPATETLRFELPAALPIREFSEIRIVFHLEPPRGYRSASIAVTGFAFVPRGS